MFWSRPKTIEGLSIKLKEMTLVKESGCHEFVGPLNPKGYGKIRFAGKHLRAHRVAYQLAFGEIPKGLLVCHKCDNPKCINSDHLFLGSAKDNAVDRKNKGRGNNQYTKNKIAKDCYGNY
jgi:hypothetical protein